MDVLFINITVLLSDMGEVTENIDRLRKATNKCSFVTHFKLGNKIKMTETSGQIKAW